MSDLFYDKLNIDDVVEEPYSDSFDDDFDDGLEYEQADGAFDDDYDVVESDSLDIADTADFFDNVDDGLASALENVSFAEEESSIDEDAFNEYDNIDDSLLLEDDSLVNGYVDDYEETSTDGQSEALVDGELQPLPKGEALDDHQVDEQVIDQALLDELISQVDNQALLENSSKSEFKQVDGVFQDVKKIKTIEGPLQVFSIGRPTKKRKKAKKRIEGVYDSRNLHKDANGIDEVVLAQNIDIEKENKKRELRTLSKQIMEEDSNGVNIAKEPSVELIKEGKSVDNMEASNNQPFMNIKAKANHAVGGVAVASVSPFLTPACIYKKDVKGQDVVQATDRNLEQAPNETALELAPENDKKPDQKIEISSSYFIKNMEVNKGEVSKEQKNMAEHLEKLSEIVEPIKEIKSSIDSNALNNRRCVDKDNEPIVCDVCGCVNKHGATMCKMCSNYLTDSNRR